MPEVGSSTQQGAADHPAGGSAARIDSWTRSIWVTRAGVLFVLLLALGVRLRVILGSTGGLRGGFGYDSGVYFAAGDAVLHGRLPYRDFLFLHPPGIALVLAPFAAIGRLTTDQTGFALANLAFAGLAAVNAALVVLVALRLGCRLWGALIGGAFYGVWYGAVGAEFSVRLEPLGNAALLVGLLLISGREQLSRRRAFLAGVALGGACCVKIWWIVPLIVTLVWVASRRERRLAAAWLAAGAVVVNLAVDGAFFLRAPGTMWRMLVRDQTGRTVFTPLSFRLDDLTGVSRTVPTLHGSAHDLVVYALLLLVAAVVVAAARRPAARLVVAILLAQVVVLLAAPSYYFPYADYIAAPLALVAALAFPQTLGGRSVAEWGRAVTVAVVVGLATASTAVTLFGRTITVIAPFPGRQLAHAVRHVRCVTSDSPSALIALNVLTRDLHRGCPVAVDLTGMVLDDYSSQRGVPMVQDRTFQAEVRAYLLSGDATIVVRPHGRIAPSTIDELYRHPYLAKVGNYRVFDLRKLR